jgi:DNA-binding CsgD family transcriptional regulator
MQMIDSAINTLERAGDIAALSAAFQRIVEDNGFFAFEAVETTELQPDTPFHFGTADEWRQVYIANGFRFIDPFLALSRRIGLPFDMSAIDLSNVQSKQVQRLVKAAAEFGMRQGLFFPHHMRDARGRLRSHFLAMIWTADERAFAETLAARRHPLHLIALHFFERNVILRGLQESAGKESETGASLLTERERQTLACAARGMTGEDIAQSMNISTLTAQTHLKNATRKLNAANRTHAVARAISRGLIEM